MIKEWYIKFNRDGDGSGFQEEGPYSLEDLKKDHRITPDTLAWKQGFADWIPIRRIPELQELFKDLYQDEEGDLENEEDDESKPVSVKASLQNEMVLDWRYDPSSFFLWVLIILIVILYVLYGSR